jgi:hypothetical protein
VRTPTGLLPRTTTASSYSLRLACTGVRAVCLLQLSAYVPRPIPADSDREIVGVWLSQALARALAPPGEILRPERLR